MQLFGCILGHAVPSTEKESFTRSLATEVGPKNIRVGVIRRPIAAASSISAGEFMKSMTQAATIKHLPTLSEVSETPAFLASDDARSVTTTIG